MDETPTDPPKRKRGRPKKDPNAPKANYNLSRAETARRETQKRIRRNKKKADQLEGQAKRYRQVVREQKKAAANVENAINGKKSRVVDQGKIGSIPK